MIWRESFIYSETTGITEVKEMSDHYTDTFGQCDNCQLESRLYCGICEDCDSEYFAEFWTGDEDEL